jgi:hypothetical protein
LRGFLRHLPFAVDALSTESCLDTARIEQLTGLMGALNQKEGVFKVNFPPGAFTTTKGRRRG